MTHQSRRQIFAGVRQAQGGNKFAEVSRRGKVLEGLEGQEKRIQCRQLSPLAEPSDGELWQARIKMGWAIRRHRKDKARGILPRGSTRTEARAIMERRQSLSLLCLTFCKSGGLVNYKRAFVTRFPFTHLLRARILFLTGEAHKGVRFLTRRSPCNPEALI
jgi:hypothetical protein